MNIHAVDIDALKKEIEHNRNKHSSALIEVVESLRWEREALLKEIKLLRTYIHQELSDWCYHESRKKDDPA